MYPLALYHKRQAEHVGIDEVLPCPVPAGVRYFYSGLFDGSESIENENVRRKAVKVGRWDDWALRTRRRWVVVGIGGSVGQWPS